MCGLRLALFPICQRQSLEILLHGFPCDQIVSSCFSCLELATLDSPQNGPDTALEQGSHFLGRIDFCTEGMGDNRTEHLAFAFGWHSALYFLFSVASVAIGDPQKAL